MLAALHFVERSVFVVSALICVFGAFGVVTSRNPVHAALSLVGTLFGVAVMFVSQGAYFLAAIQVIVYAGAIVVLIVFVMMLLGVDTVESFVKERDPLTLAIAGVLAGGMAALSLVVVWAGDRTLTGEVAAQGALDQSNDLAKIGESLFTDYLCSFAITSVLLCIAVIGAVVMARRIRNEPIDIEEFDQDTAAEEVDVRD